MKTFEAILSVAVAVSILTVPVVAKPRKAKRARVEDEDRPATRYDVASFVARALDMMAAARGSGKVIHRGVVEDLQALTHEMRDETAGLSGRLDRLTQQTKELQAEIRDMHERRRR